MEIIRFYKDRNSLKLKVETLEDLWSVQRILFKGDALQSESMRRFRSTEDDTGELKEVMIRIIIEKSELDKNAQRLRVTGKIIEGRPLEYVKLNTYHTLNVGPKETIEITKNDWPEYLMHSIEEAVKNSGKRRLAIIAMDDEKAMPAYVLGYGIEFLDPIYSKLSKRMTPKDFTEREGQYFMKVIDLASKMNTDLVVIAGPGFTKDNLKKFFEEKEMQKKMIKRLMFMHTSNVEKSGVFELIKSDQMSELLSKEQVRSEFKMMEDFLKAVSVGRAWYGAKVQGAIESQEAQRLMVNDRMLSDERIKKLLNEAEAKGIHITIFNSGDEVGEQLQAFGGIAAI
jgi:protein pelota